MAEDDDIERLLREIDEMNAGKSQSSASKSVQPAADTGREPRPVPRGRTARTTWTLVAAAGSGVIGFFAGSVLWMMPGTLSTALGAALGGAVTGLIGGPPKWMKP